MLVRGLVCCSLWGRRVRHDLATEQQQIFPVLLSNSIFFLLAVLPQHVGSCIGEGNGNPLQCSCLENPRDGGAWWTAVYGVIQSRT